MVSARIQKFTAPSILAFNFIEKPKESSSENTLLVIPIKSGELLSATLAITDDLKIKIQNYFNISLDLNSLLELFPEADGKIGETFSYKINAMLSLLFIGTTSDSKEVARKTGVAIGRFSRGKKLSVYDFTLVSLTKKCDYEASYAHIQGLILPSYQWKLSNNEKSNLQSTFHLYHSDEDALHYSKTIGDGVFFARDLIHTPSNIKNPKWFADEVTKATKDSKLTTLNVEITQGEKLDSFGGLLAVGNSARKPGARLLELHYLPKAKTKPTKKVVLVGKGITYDTGGISLKRPYDVMAPMKSDMAGAAAVIATVLTAAKLELPIEIHAIALLAENSISGSAQRPSDVITQYGGKTVEILNTDAEGRLLLADGLSYGISKYQPDFIVDIATLTGAATLGLSRQVGALYSASGKIIKTLLAAGNFSGDRLWHMPLVEEYEVSLESDIADLNHTADKGDFSGGSITAALFLEQFIPAENKDTWAHLDIAGPARSDGDAGENVKGGTGFGVRVLVEWLKGIG